MHKLNLIADGNNSIDFDFFEAEGDRFKTYDNGKNDSSKIITRAVIETKPKGKSKTNKTSDFTLKTLKLINEKNKENPVQTISNDCLFSPTSSEENRVLSNSVEDLTLFNCLAFNNDGKETQIYNMDDKYLSDNSLSDSTITTVTSDFTTVSRLSSVSDSSCGSDLSTDSSTPQSCESLTSRPNDDMGNSSENTYTEDFDGTEVNTGSTKMKDLSDEPENLIHESDNSIDFNDKQQGNDSDDEEQESNSNRGRDSDVKNHNTDSRKTSTGSQSSRVSEIENNNENLECSQSQCNSLSRKGSISTIGERLGDISLASHSSSSSNIARPHYCRGQNKFRSKKKELNLTFSREELIKIERDNTILLKKIMAYSKPRSVSLNHTFSHKKTSAAINRARQQKKIEQDNYILYNKINSMSRMKKVF